MNNMQGSFIHAGIKSNQDRHPKIPVKEFIFEDHFNNGSFIFREMKLELFSDGKWCFYITAEGKHTTTILRNGRKSGPFVFISFNDENGILIKEEELGQINYDCLDDSANSFICKGRVEQHALISAISIRYDSFMDFACRRN